MNLKQLEQAQKELLLQANELGTKIERLKAEQDKPVGGRLWLPELGNRYWHIIDTSIQQADWDDDKYDHERYAHGVVFKTKEEAESHTRYLQALYEIKKYIAENFSAWEPDWDNTSQTKFIVSYDHMYEHLTWNSWFAVHPLSILPPLQSTEQVEQLIAAQKDNLLIVFGVKS
jgi:hypothetical protein